MYYKILLLLLLKILNITSIEYNKCIRKYDPENSLYDIECDNVNKFPVRSLLKVGRNTVPSIGSIKFTNSVYSHIPSGAFEGVSIKKVDLSGLHVETLEVGCFSGLEDVEEIDLVNNNLTSLIGGIFNHLSTLKRLDLTNNNISSIKNDTFTGLIKLELLQLEKNLIKTLPSDVFMGLNALKNLSLSSNHLETISFNLSNVPLESLNVAFNQIISIGSLPKTLTSLYVTNNKLTDLRFISELHNLKHLNLASNNLTIQLNSFHNLTKLRLLNMQSNHITTIPIGSMRFLTDLEELNLSFNLIQTLDFGTLAGLEKLTKLDISHNEIESLNEAVFYDLKALKTLNIESTNIKNISISKLFHQCKQLKNIIMSKLKISCTDLVKLIVDANSKNINIKKGDTFDTSNINGISCIKNDSYERSLDDESKETIIKEDIERALNESLLFNILTNLIDANLETKNNSLEMTYFRLRI